MLSIERRTYTSKDTSLLLSKTVVTRQEHAVAARSQARKIQRTTWLLGGE